MLASIVIRTLNEARHLEALLTKIAAQDSASLEWEIIIVDSGSTDGTLEIVSRQPCCRLVHITRQEFSFGRSLNRGCEAASGEILVMISGHCVPVGESWLEDLCRPLIEGTAEYTYGRQIGGPRSYFSEKRIFAKYFPERSNIPQQGFFCNNANAAISRGAWTKYRFNEDLTGLEDMEIAKRLVADRGRVAYVAEACVYHYHEESWEYVRRRFEREALALQHIMPQVHIRRRDLLRYIATSILKDCKRAFGEGIFLDKCSEIVMYRLCQYWGSYKGNHDHRKLSHEQKEHYFFPH